MLYNVGMYIARVPNRSSPPAYLLRESYREGGKVKNRTLANLSHLPLEQIELMRRVLRGETLVSPSEAFSIGRSRPHGLRRGAEPPLPIAARPDSGCRGQDV